jgi:hypothetical protein
MRSISAIYQCYCSGLLCWICPFSFKLQNKRSLSATIPAMTGTGYQSCLASVRHIYCLYQSEADDILKTMKIHSQHRILGETVLRLHSTFNTGLQIDTAEGSSPMQQISWEDCLPFSWYIQLMSLWKKANMKINNTHVIASKHQYPPGSPTVCRFLHPLKIFHVLKTSCWTSWPWTPSTRVNTNHCYLWKHYQWS